MKPLAVMPALAFFCSAALATPLSAQSVHVAETRATTHSSAVKPLPSSQFLYGKLPISTHSKEARAALDLALDQYENAYYDTAVVSSRKASEADPKLALAYALWSFAAHRTEPDPAALAKAKFLAPHCAGDECLLINFMVGSQESNMLPAISAMNDLLTRRPKDKHILFLSATYLYNQQNFDRAKDLLVRALEVDPEFPGALNMLGYVELDCSTPDPKKAIDYLRRYASVLPHDANPQDSLGEVLRMAGDDSGSLAHYAEALRISSTMITSQYGRGDTYSMMADGTRARAEYDKALRIATINRDALHIQFQQALLPIWLNDVSGARTQLAALSAKFALEKDAGAQFELDFARALLAPNPASEREILIALEGLLSVPQPGMLDADRNSALGQVLRERVRIEVASKQILAAQVSLQKLQQLAESSNDPALQNVADSAQGYIVLAHGDFANAATLLASDTHSPLAVRALLLAQEKLDNPSQIDATRNRLKYLRKPTAEWYLATRNPGLTSQIQLP